MGSIFVNLQSLMGEFVIFLNQPAIKDGVKNTAGLITCLFGIIELYAFIFYKQNTKTSPTLFLAKVSICLSPLITRPGIWLISSIAAIFSFQIDNYFGDHTIFAVNPWYPKHIASFVAVFFAIPAIYEKINPFPRIKKAGHGISNWVFFVLLFNTLTSRPVLHLTNQLALFLTATFE